MSRKPSSLAGLKKREKKSLLGKLTVVVGALVNFSPHPMPAFLNTLLSLYPTNSPLEYVVQNQGSTQGS
jgi:hypothetical protein